MDSGARIARVTSATAVAAKRIDPPEDFIDTSAVDEPGTECLAVDFERQELRVIFETMDRNNIFYKMLAVEQIVSVPPPPPPVPPPSQGFNRYGSYSRRSIGRGGMG